MAWKEKHKRILKNKDNIIKKFKDSISIEEIAKENKVSEGCIYKNLKLWGTIKKHGIKYLLKNMLSEEGNKIGTL